MGQSTWSGPVRIGDTAAGSSANTGTPVLSQSVSLVQAGESAVSGTVNIPTGAVIVDIIFDVTVAYDSATSATGTVGITAGGTEYASGVNAKTAIRVRPTQTRPQLIAMAAPTTTAVVATITAVGATTAGAAKVHVLYLMT
jgi:hypothetical protein